MAESKRIESLSVLLDPTGKMLLDEQYKGVIENVRVNTISSRLKNTQLSGDPDAGTLFAKRFVNAKSQAYGTARGKNAGEKIKGKDVVVVIDKDREFVEELEQKDAKLLGVNGLLSARAGNHSIQMANELDEAFFAAGATEGTAFTPTKTAIADIVEEAIVTLATIKTDYIHGIPRNLMEVVCSPAVYSQMRDYLDKQYNTGTTTQNEAFGKFHGVAISESINLPEGTGFELMVNGSIAQPVMSSSYQAERIGLSEAYGVSLFFHYGTKVVTPETVLVYKPA